MVESFQFSPSLFRRSLVANMAESEKFQHYEVQRNLDGTLHELGRGAMGVTYKAFDMNLRIDVALKVISPAFLGSEVARQRFLREARSAAALRHANVASVLHLGNEGDTCFYSMEFVEGETVDARLRRDGPLPVRTALEIALQVTRALIAADKQKLVHRDLKPANIMLQKEDDGAIVVKVIDFGLAKAVESESAGDLTLTQGGFLGTPHFASPEQLEEKSVDVRSDIYSLGVTLWCMLTGKAPFSGSMAQVMSKHLYKPVPVEQLVGLPASVVNLLKHMLEKQPNDRPQVSDLRREIEAALLTLPSGDVVLTQDSGSISDDHDAMATLMDEPGPPSASSVSPPSPPPLNVAAPSPQRPPITPGLEHRNPSRTFPIAIALVALISLVGGGAYLWFHFQNAIKSASAAPLQKPIALANIDPKATTPKPVVSTPPAEVVSVPVKPIEAPPPTPKVTQTPPAPPPPPKKSPLIIALSTAQDFVNSEDYSSAMVTLVEIARKLPEETEPRRRLESICARFIRDEKPADRESYEKIQAPLEDAAALGITSAAVLLAENLRDRDVVRALDLYEKAALSGDVIALRQGGLLYSNRKQPGDMARAVSFFQRGADSGDAASAYLAGESYLLGKGVTSDTTKGLDYLNRAASKDYPAAIDRLGDYYYRVTKEYDKAFSLFERARRLDWGPSFGNLGVLYMNGKGTAPDAVAGADLFRQGAEKGDPSSMFLYAQCLENGVGLTANVTEARKWLKLAAEKGDSRAEAELRKAKR
jgi:serine/threonine protein kinase/TPR repeat protein